MRVAVPNKSCSMLTSHMCEFDGNPDSVRNLQASLHEKYDVAHICTSIFCNSGPMQRWTSLCKPSS